MAKKKSKIQFEAHHLDSNGKYRRNAFGFPCYIGRTEAEAVSRLMAEGKPNSGDVVRVYRKMFDAEMNSRLGAEVWTQTQSELISEEIMA